MPQPNVIRYAKLSLGLFAHTFHGCVPHVSGSIQMPWGEGASVAPLGAEGHGGASVLALQSLKERSI